MSRGGFEQLGFGKIENPEIKGLYPKDSEKYVLFHFISKYGFLSGPTVLKEITLERLKGYLEGASLGKEKEMFKIYNGIPENVRKIYFHELELSSLDKNGLKRLLHGTGLNERLGCKIESVK
jgi:hypothetical protein